jgi:hypothetical protein
MFFDIENCVKYLEKQWSSVDFLKGRKFLVWQLLSILEVLWMQKQCRKFYLDY